MIGGGSMEANATTNKYLESNTYKEIQTDLGNQLERNGTPVNTVLALESLYV